jgi:cell division protein FtsQ
MDGSIPPLRLRMDKKISPPPWTYCMIFLFFAILLFVLFLRSPLSEVTHVHIKGNRLLSDQEVLTKTRVKKGMSIFHFHDEQVQSVLQRLPEIKSVDVETDFPGHVYIKVLEKPIVAWWQTQENGVVPILTDGKALLHRPITDLNSARKDKPIFTGWTKFDSTAQKASQQLAQVSPRIQQEIIYVKPAPAKDQVLLITKYQHQVLVRAHQLQKKIKLYPSFRKHPHGTIYLLESIWFSPGFNLD